MDGSPSRTENVHKAGGCNFDSRRFGYKICQQGYRRQYVLLGRSKTYRYGVNVRATNYSGVTDELKKKIDKKTTSIANKVKKNDGKVKAGLKTKGFFFIMRMIQKSGWNEADKNYWAERGWNGKNRPWKNT